MKLENKVAVVTGAASHGIGRGIVQAFLTEGSRVAVIDRHLPGDFDEPGSVVPAGPLGLQGDVSDPDQLVTQLHVATVELGPIDVLVNAAAITHRKPFLDLTLDEWDEVHAVDIRPYFVATQWVARTLLARRSPGSIINVASINGTSVTPGQAHYCAAKGGVVMLTKAAAVELAEHRIRVNSISPGCIETDLNRHLTADPQFRALRTNPIPLGRVGQPRDVAPIAVLLASDEAGFITGTDIIVDGGQLACSSS